MKRGNRPRNKKKFGSARPEQRRSKDTTVKVKPKEHEPCRTRNPKPLANV